MNLDAALVNLMHGAMPPDDPAGRADYFEVLELRAVTHLPEAAKNKLYLVAAPANSLAAALQTERLHRYHADGTRLLPLAPGRRGRKTVATST
jgi:hypothetical protein